VNRVNRRTATDTTRPARTSEIIFLVSDSPEGGFAARALGHLIYTEADTPDELRTMVRDAVAVHFDECERPGMIRLRFVREEVPAATGRRATLTGTA
jgi:hypothetical protein